MSQVEAIVETMNVPIDQIKPSPYQPRLSFNLEDIRGSIQRDGILVPLTVRKKNGYYELIDGERRVRLAKELGHKSVSCTVIDVDDETARRLVYKVNRERKNYTPYEEAVFFKKLVEEEKMKPYQIEVELGASHHWVQACLNVWKFPEDIQKNVFGPRASVPYKIYMSDIRELEDVINRNIDEATTILREVIKKRMTTDEKRELISRRRKKISEETVEKAEEAIEEVASELKKPETPEEFEAAAKALMEEAKRRKTPEQKREELREMAQKALNSFPSLDKADDLGVDIRPFKERVEEIQSLMEEKPKEALDKIKSLKKELKKEVGEAKAQREEEERKRREEEMQRKIEDEAKRRAKELEEAEKRRIEEEAKKKAQEEILNSPELLQEVAQRAREERYEEFAEMQRRAREVAQGIAEPLGEALIRAEDEAMVARTSEGRRVLESYMFLGSIIKALEGKRIFCFEHSDEEPMLMWSCGTPITKTHEKLRAKLRLGE